MSKILNFEEVKGFILKNLDSLGLSNVMDLPYIRIFFINLTGLGLLNENKKKKPGLRFGLRLTYRIFEYKKIYLIECSALFKQKKHAKIQNYLLQINTEILKTIL
ncbi:hypothetical protein BpHYR1_030609 [Brachionus plicatilis]|uniref:Uncharacterized protein n=1 Tax=Brachionus plicatilis TaxID=10195 RepID=A0A3M7Q3W5_BRAPC|nr:hypothetical protein BpHYR1_030609 [Brachionus plicatilis]